MDQALQERPYGLNSGDSIAFLNLSGGKHATEILLKDRYKHFWVFDKSLKLLWTGSGQTGHFPYPYDINGDGRSDVLQLCSESSGTVSIEVHSWISQTDGSFLHVSSVSARRTTSALSGA